MTLAVDIVQKLGDFQLNARFESGGRLTALFGPSGSGKSSLINLISGLSRPDHGAIRVGETVFVDTKRGVFLPPDKRRIGYVFQDGRLFPHLTVEHNLGFGRWFTPKAERYANFDQVVDLLDIRPLLKRKPASLSGGEKQRVAIGRALLASPRLILMDEPLSALDETRKREILPYIERLRDETRIPVVYVSHSIAEVVRLATDIVVLSRGDVAIAGPASDVMRRPDLLPAEDQGEGGAVLEAIVDGQDIAAGMTRLTTPAGTLLTPRVDMADGTKLRLRIRSRDVMIATEEPRGISALNILPGTVAEVRPSGETQVEVDIACRDTVILARITRHSQSMLGIVPGKAVFAIVKSVSLERPTVAPRALSD